MYNDAAIFIQQKMCIMKKGLLVLVLFLFSGAMALYGKRISYLIAEKPQTKTVRFSVFAGTDYSSALYKRSKAKVFLTICRFSGSQQEIVWEGIIDEGYIKNYPETGNSLIREISVHNVYDVNESLAAYYKVIYDNKGSEMSYQQGISLSPGTGIDSLKISI